MASGGYGISRYAHKLGGRNLGEPGKRGLGGPPAARLDGSRNACAVCRRHHFVAAPLACGGCGRPARLGGPGALSLPAGPDAFHGALGRRPSASWCRRDDDGTLPAGVPPMLLQGQSNVALSGKVTTEALNRSGLDPEADDVTFDYSASERGDVIRLTVTAPTEEAAGNLAGAYASACGVAPPGGRRAVPDAEPGGPDHPRHAPGTPRPGRGRAGPGRPRSARQPARHRRAARRGHRREYAAQAGILLPANTPPATAQLVYERQDLMSRIEGARRDFAQGTTTALVPHAPRPWSSGTIPRTSRPSH